MKALKRIVSLFLVLTLLLTALGIGAFACEKERYARDVTVQRISNPDRGEREVDGLIEGGDRENSYTWRLAMRGDEIYIATTRNIASALVNMYGGEFAKAGIDIDTFWAMIDVVANGDIPRNDANEGANIISYNRKTGEFKVIYTAGTADYFRMAVTFGDDVYFGSYSAVPTNPQYILKLDTEGNFTKVFQTMGSVSLRANCEYDGHLFFAGADDREIVPEGETAPVAKMAVLMKSNEDDTVWDRVADYKDFGATAYDPIHTSWAGAPIWELASHNGYIYATAPTLSGFVIYKGHPAADGEQANEYGWYWQEVAGTTNGVNNPGLSDIEGGEPGTMRSLIGSVYEFNGELYAYNFDHSFGGEASAFAGMLQQVAGKDVKASEYLFYLYDSLHNPQKVWKLNDETGKFEELKAFTELIEGTTNEYVWRLGQYDGDLYVATMDAGIFYNYLTQLTNGNFFTMSLSERLEQIGYIKNLIALLASAKGNEKYEEIRAKLAELQALLESYNPDEEFSEDVYEKLSKISEIREAVNALIDELTAKLTDEIAPNSDDELAATGAFEDDEFLSQFLSRFFTEEDLQELYGMLNGDTDNEMPESGVDITVIINDVDWNQVKETTVANVKAFIDAKLAELKAKIDELYSKVDWKGLEMYAYINSAVMADEWGFDMFRTSDGGETFEVITRDGFGDKYNYGCPAFLETEEGLYFGTCNPFYGGQLYLLRNTEPVPQGFTLGGKATSYKTNEGVDNVTLKLNGCDNNFTATVTVTAEYKGVKADNDYTFENIPAGSYVLSVEKGNHVTREYTVAVSGDTTQDVKICPIGDADNNGRVNAADAKAVFQHASEQVLIEDEYKFACSDVAPRKGVINSADSKSIFQHVNEQKSLWTVTSGE